MSYLLNPYQSEHYNGDENGINQWLPNKKTKSEQNGCFEKQRKNNGFKFKKQNKTKQKKKKIIKKK